jgi:hypothetical protein
MKINGESFIRAFKQAFTNLLEKDQEHIAFCFAHSNRAAWTQFIKTELCPRIANLLQLECETKEFLRIDVLLSRKVNEYLIPHVWIESENDYQEAVEGEAIKLLSLNGPVKVLFTRDDSWNKTRLDADDEHWTYVLQEFKLQSRLQGDFIVIIFHANTELSYPVYEVIRYDDLGVKQVMTDFAPESQLNSLSNNDFT